MTTRQDFIKWAKWGIARAGQIHYKQIRPIPLRLAPGSLPLTTDCSGSTILYAKWAKIPAQQWNDYYTGQGYTGTILSGPHIARQDAIAGDLVVFGRFPGTHVAILLENASRADPLLASHGQEIGPLKVSLSAEMRAHPGQPLTFIRSVSLTKPPGGNVGLTDAQKLDVKEMIDNSVKAIEAGADIYIAGGPRPDAEREELQGGFDLARKIVTKAKAP